MKKYSASVPGHIIRRLEHWVMIGLLFVLLVIVGILIYLGVWFFGQQSDNQAQPTSAGETTLNNPFKTFQTQYFSFKTDKTWKFVPEESTSNIFVYRSHKNNLVLRDLTVYVNATPSSTLLTRILATNPGQNSFKNLKTSNHCKDNLPANYLSNSRSPVEVTVDGVSFICQADSNQTIVGTGVRGSGLGATLTRKNGTTAQYFLLYHDLEFTPKISTFELIAEDFKSL